MISVLVVDDHPLVQAGLQQLFQNTEFNVVETTDNLEHAEKYAIEQKPDVILLDVRMKGKDGLKSLETIRENNPEQAVVVFSAFDNPTYVARAIALGAQNYVLKSESIESLKNSIRDAYERVEPGPESLFQRIRSTMKRRQDSSDTEYALTRRELQVLRHLALGLSNREIGKSLQISVETVKEHVQNVLRKVNANDRTQAAVWAVKQGLD